MFPNTTDRFLWMLILEKMNIHLLGLFMVSYIQTEIWTPESLEFLQVVLHHSSLVYICFLPSRSNCCTVLPKLHGPYVSLAWYNDMI
jgi:hypothetical protein